MSRMGCSSKVISPSVGSFSPAKRLSSVDLPLPEAPMMVYRVPSWKV